MSRARPLTLAAAALVVACTAPKDRPPMTPNHDDAAIASERARARDLGIHVGRLSSGEHDAITDVPGVLVGHATVREDGRLNTGVTVIRPHAGNPFEQKCAAALAVQNGFGKLVGATQLDELGELESPIALTATLNVHRVADGVLDWLLALPGNERVRSANAVVGETNDGRTSDIRARAVGSDHVAAALDGASGGPVEVGAIGAGAGTVCFGWKGGIGSSSRLVDGYTVGVLVQSKFGGSLVIDGVPVGERLDALEHESDHDGSCMIVIATDAPLDQAALRRLATRSFAGMARTGASFSHGSGDYAIAFSTTGLGRTSLRGGELSPLFVAVADATEQAIVDSLCAAESIRGIHGPVEALPLEPVLEILGRE